MFSCKLNANRKIILIENTGQNTGKNTGEAAGETAAETKGENTRLFTEKNAPYLIGCETSARTTSCLASAR